MSTMLVIGFSLLIIVFIIGVILNLAFLNRLKKSHALKWKELGEPTLFYNNSIKNSLGVKKFIRERQDLALGDSRLSLLTMLNKYFGIIYVIYFIAFVALAIIFK
jgi:hypothetical protein